MPLDCSTCEAFATTGVQVVQPCLQGGTHLYRDDASAGEKQIPLLHLLYGVCTQHFAPGPREVRATWLAPTFSKTTGKQLKPRLHHYTQSSVEGQVNHLIGMALAQRVRALPLWAQLPRGDQLALAARIAAAIRDPAAEELMVVGSFEVLNGALVDQRGLRQYEAWLASALERWTSVKEETESRRARIVGADEALRRMVAEREDGRIADAALARLRELRGLIASTFAEHGDLAPFQGDGVTLVEKNTVLAVDYLLDTMDGDVREEYTGLRARFGWIDDAVAELDRARGALGELEAERDGLVVVITGCQKDLHSGRGYQRDAEAAIADEQYAVQMAALQNDFALQDANYTDTTIPALLRQALGQRTRYGAVARQLFLYMHPRLKYRWTQPLACRAVKLLTSAEFLDAYHLLTHGDGGETPPLAQPGPFAKLGVFVMNATTPGSYDARHRQLVQWELDDLVEAMLEYRMDPTIVCHSCGSDSYGAPGMRGWIRDHNPPTALVGAAATALGLPTHTDRWGTTGRQILLPQCQECSTRQGAVTNKIVELWTAHGGTLTGQSSGDVRAALAALLPSEEDRADFLRLVLSPGVGWNNPGIDGTRLVTTGQPGSFAGVDDDYLGALGDTLGCHTCTDVPAQTDPYRNVSWIADHQPPTALVERGLAELPQVVYPHCLQCSNTQSRLVAALARLFDGCFGKKFTDTWIAAIQETGYDEV